MTSAKRCLKPCRSTLLGLLPAEMTDRACIIFPLEKAIARQSRAARQGARHYDLTRHMRLIEALKAEKTAEPLAACRLSQNHV